MSTSRGQKKKQELKSTTALIFTATGLPDVIVNMVNEYLQPTVSETSERFFGMFSEADFGRAFPDRLKRQYTEEDEQKDTEEEEQKEQKYTEKEKETIQSQEVIDRMITKYHLGEMPHQEAWDQLRNSKIVSQYITPHVTLNHFLKNYFPKKKIAEMAKILGFSLDQINGKNGPKPRLELNHIKILLKDINKGKGSNKESVESILRSLINERRPVSRPVLNAIKADEGRTVYYHALALLDTSGEQLGELFNNLSKPRPPEEEKAMEYENSKTCKLILAGAKINPKDLIAILKPLKRLHPLDDDPQDIVDNNCKAIINYISYRPDAREIVTQGSPSFVTKALAAWIANFKVDYDADHNAAPWSDIDVYQLKRSEIPEHIKTLIQIAPEEVFEQLGRLLDAHDKSNGKENVHIRSHINIIIKYLFDNKILNEVEFSKLFQPGGLGYKAMEVHIRLNEDNVVSPSDYLKKTDGFEYRVIDGMLNKLFQNRHKISDSPRMLIRILNALNLEDKTRKDITGLIVEKLEANYKEFEKQFENYVKEHPNLRWSDLPSDMYKMIESIVDFAKHAKSRGINDPIVDKLITINPIIFKNEVIKLPPKEAQAEQFEAKRSYRQ